MESFKVTTGTETHVGAIACTGIIRDVFYACDDSIDCAATAVIQYTHRMHRGPSRHANHIDAVIYSGNGSRYMRAMPIAIIGTVFASNHKIFSGTTTYIEVWMVQINSGIYAIQAWRS